jgi:tetratricopeptide (TPR) repeat protein
MKKLFPLLFALLIFSCAEKKTPYETYIDYGYEKGNNLNDYEGAIADYTKAIEFEPKNPLAFLHRGTAFMQLNKNNDACSDFNKYIELGGDPKDVKGFKMIVGCPQ